MGAAGNLEIAGTDILMLGSGSKAADASKGETDAKAIIRTSAQTTLTDESSITVKSGYNGGLFNTNFIMDGNSSISIESGGSLYVAGFSKKFNNPNQVAPVTYADGTFTLKSGTINNAGELTFGANNAFNKSGTVEYSLSKFDFNMQGGTINNTGVLNVGAELHSTSSDSLSELQKADDDSINSMPPATIKKNWLYIKCKWWPSH